MKVLITGGCGFIGSNAARYFSERGDAVIAVDNLSRSGATEHARYVEQLPGARLIVADLTVADGAWRSAIDALTDDDAVLHLAGQVAVTSSIQDPRADFQANTAATLNLLESIRSSGRRPALVFSSTNKVYGGLEAVVPQEMLKRYDGESVRRGFDETTALDFYSPYGCSKGAADQYVRDYARTYGLRNVVFRQSCIYGPRQFGVEDQGWLAWFAIASLLGLPVTIYGNGKQVRDVLHVEDLIRAFAAAIARIEEVAGEVFNVGGGPENTLSLLELLDILDRSFGLTTQASHKPTRLGDQKVFVSNLNKAREGLGWEPQVPLQQGIGSMLEWCRDHLDVIERLIRQREAGSAVPCA